MTNKNPESGAYETPAADSHINNLEWIIQKRSGSNPSNNILSRSLSAQWGLKQQTDTESNTLRAKNKLNQKQENIIFFHCGGDKGRLSASEHQTSYFSKKKLRLERGGWDGETKKKRGCTRETNSTTATSTAINKGSSTRSMNTPAALCMNLIFSKWEIILSLRSFNRKSLERALTKVHHLYPPWLLAAYNPQINCTRKLGP